MTDPDLSSVADGIYEGEYALHPHFGIYVANNDAEQEVRVLNHSYDDIVIKPAALKDRAYIKNLKNLILERQTLQVDTLSGGISLSGKAFLLVIEDAVE